MNMLQRLPAILILFAGLLSFPQFASAQFLGAIGGIEGVGEDANATPLFTMTGEANTKEGTGVVGVAYAYTRFTRLFGEKIENPSNEFGIPTEDFNRAVEATSRVFLLGYGVTSRLNLGASVPFIEVRSRLPLTSTDPAEEQQSHGIGNVAFSAKYQFSSEPNLAVRLSAQLPSGYEAGADYFQLAGDIAYSVELGPVSLHLQGGYIYSDVDRQELNHLNTAIANLALARRIGKGFTAVLELNYQRLMGDDDLEGVLGQPGVAYQDPPTQQGLDLTPGFKVQVKENIVVASAVRIALINDLFFGYDTAYLLLAGYSF
jgi:hypothetical protein